MREILFNTKMICAILDGKKTVTRRLIKEPWGDSCPHCRYVHNEFIYDNLAENVYCARCGEALLISPFVGKGYEAPYQIGDIMYVRETWCETLNEILYYAGGGYEGMHDMKWMPSIHMPKEAARIFLKVTDVRVEKLQDISAQEIHKEGISNGTCSDCLKIMDCAPQKDVNVFCGNYEQLEEQFVNLWNSTVKNQDLNTYSWDANPWVWVIEFERCKKPKSEEDEPHAN